MTDKQKKWIAWAITTAVILAVNLYFGMTYPLPPLPEAVIQPAGDEIIALGTTHFTNVSAEDLTATDDLSVSDDAAVGDDATIGGDLTVSGTLFPSFADETITSGETLTPTKTVYALDSAGAVTMTLAASGTEGQVLILIGDDNNAVTVNDTNVRTADGNALAIGQYEVAMWVYQDSEWILIANTDDS